MEKIVVLSGAGISAESGLPTFRGEGGMWNGIDVSRVATARAWEEDPAAVLEFYNRRRAALRDAKPNEAHRLVAELERWYDVTVVTQNIDDLHECAGSRDIIHLHGELTLARPEDTFNVDDGFDEAHVSRMGYDPISLGDTGGRNREQMRPHVVLFGEPVPKMGLAALRVREADILLIVGTSLQVEPAASLYDEVSADCKVFVIDPNPSPVDGDLFVTHIFKKATDGMRDFLLKQGIDLTTVLVKKWLNIDREVDEASDAAEVFYVLDEHGRCLSRTNDYGRTLFWYDASGHIARIEDINIAVRSFEYDGDGYPVRERIEDGEYESVRDYKWSRDRRKVEIWGDDRVRFYYRPDGRMKHRIKGWYPPEMDETFYKWDGRGNLIGVRSIHNYEGQTYEYNNRYSSSGRLEYWDVLGERISYAYVDDPCGNWVRMEGRKPDGRMVVLAERTIRYGNKGFSRVMAPDPDGNLWTEEDIKLNNLTNQVSIPDA